jgi:hypothetical protein
MFVQIDSRQILAKVETVEGTDSTPAGTTDAVQSFDGSIEIDYQVLERNIDRAFFGAKPRRLIGRRARLRYTIELVGASTVGTAAPIGPILRASGRAEALTPTTRAAYNPITTGAPSLTHYFFFAGLRFRVVNSRCTVRYLYEIDQRPRAEVEVLGVVTAAIDEAAIPAVTLTAWREPPPIDAASWNVTVNGVTVECFAVRASENNDLRVRHHSEARRVIIGGRSIEGELVMDPQALATLNPFVLAETPTLVPIISAVNGGASLIVRHTWGQAQLLAPRLIEVERGAAWSLPFVAGPTAAGNNDDLIEFE